MSTVAWRPGEAPSGPVPGAGGGRLGRLLASVSGRRAAAPRGAGGGAPAAVFFDMDGLLIDSEPLWTIAEVALAEHVGGLWNDDIKAQCIGKRMDDSVPLMLTGLGQPVTPQTVAAAEALLMRRMTELFAEHLPLLPGVTGLLGELGAHGVPCALVSSSYRVLVDACLLALGEHPFSVSIAGDEVERAKPDPQPYLLAAAALGLDPAHCVVLEDSAAGATAGVAAGCVTVLVPGATVPSPPNGGWTQVSSLTELSVASLGELVARG